MQGWRERLRSLFIAPKEPVYQEQLRTSAQFTHKVAAPEPLSPVEQSIAWLLAIVTPEDWERYGKVVTLMRVSKKPGRLRNYPKHHIAGYARALVMRLPNNVDRGLTSDGTLLDLMPAFDSDGHPYYESYRALKVTQLSDYERRLIEKGLQQWINKIEARS